MKTVLLIGSSGFIGTALKNKLAAYRYTIHEFSQIDGDIAKAGSLEKFSGTGIEHVFHLAARTFVPDSWMDPYPFYEVNVLGTVNALEFCRKNNCALTLVGSYLYGSPDYLPIDESHPLKIYNPYSQTKLFSECVAFFYKEHFSVNVTAFRLFNAYGAGQSANFLIPTIIQQLLDSSIPEVIVKDLVPKRDYIYIDDIVEALVMSIEKEPGVYNLGTGYSVSVEEIILLLREITGIHKPYRSLGDERQNEVSDLYSDISRIKKAFSWEPQFGIKEGLTECVRAVQGKLRS